MQLIESIRSSLVHEGNVRAGDRVVVGFSGGPDSTALLWGLKRLQPELALEIRAVHVDHAIDDESEDRARAARYLSRKLETPFHSVRLQGLRDLRSGSNLESHARRLRYDALEAERCRLGARWILTGHHANDQIETVLLRMAYGSGIEGLAGIRPRYGRVLRPLLEVSREQILSTLSEADIEPVQDPSNHDLRSARNRLRHRVWPLLSDQDPQLGRRLLSVAQAASRTRLAIERQLGSSCRIIPTDRGAETDLQSLLALPSELWPHLLSWLSRAAGRPYPPPATARHELTRQLSAGGQVGCDCGHGWRWESNGETIGLYRARPTTASFAYTVTAPGECRIAELSLGFRIRTGEVDDWMFQPSRWRAGLVLPILPGCGVVVRNRRQGDRIRPFGCGYTRRLKDVLIDRRVPRWQRDRLPLLEVEGRLAWIPGVTIDDSCRVEAGGRAWIVELEPL